MYYFIIALLMAFYVPNSWSNEYSALWSP